MSWDWQHDGSRVSTDEVVLVWHETNGGWDDEDIDTTDVTIIRMEDPRGSSTGNTPQSYDSWLIPQGGQNTLAANHADNNLNVPITTIEEGGKYELEVVVRQGIEPPQPLFLEVRTATNDHGTTWSDWKRLSTEVGRYALAIQEQSEWDLYTSRSKITECFDPAYLYSCVGGTGAWQSSGFNEYKLVLTIVSHDDNYVDEPERYYQFRFARTANATKGTVYPVLKVTEDDGVVFSLHPQQEEGQLRVYLAKKVFTDTQFTLWTDNKQSVWYNRVVTYNAGEFGSKVIDRSCGTHTDDVRVWATLNAGQHDGVPQYIDYYDGRVDKDDDRKGEYVLVKCS